MGRHYPDPGWPPPATHPAFGQKIGADRFVGQVALAARGASQIWRSG